MSAHAELSPYVFSSVLGLSSVTQNQRSLGSKAEQEGGGGGGEERPDENSPKQSAPSNRHLRTVCPACAAYDISCTGRSFISMATKSLETLWFARGTAEDVLTQAYSKQGDRSLNR